MTIVGRQSVSTVEYNDCSGTHMDRFKTRGNNIISETTHLPDGIKSVEKYSLKGDTLVVKTINGEKALKTGILKSIKGKAIGLFRKLAR